MVAVALIVLLLALLLTIGVISGAGESLSVDLLGSEVTTTGTGLYFAGLVTGLATLSALWLLRVGLRKGWRHHKHVKDLERRAERADERPSDEERPGATGRDGGLSYGNGGHPPGSAGAGTSARPAETENP